MSIIGISIMVWANGPPYSTPYRYFGPFGLAALEIDRFGVFG